jgi:hypothetical protein
MSLEFDMNPSCYVEQIGKKSKWRILLYLMQEYSHLIPEFIIYLQGEATTRVQNHARQEISRYGGISLRAQLCQKVSGKT